MTDAVLSRRAVLGGGLAAVASPGLVVAAMADEGAAAAPLRIGVLLDTSGPASTHGERQLLGVRHQTEMINAGSGEQIRLFIRDTEGNPDVTRTHADELLRRYDVDGLVGTSLLPTAIAVMDLAQRAGVPMVAPTVIPRPEQPFVFCSAATAQQVPGHLMRSVAAASLRRVAVLIQENLATSQVLTPFHEEAAANGLDLVAVQPFQPSDGTLMDPVSALIGTAPDAILVITPPPFNTRAALAAHALGWSGRLYCGPSAGYPDFIRLAGPAAEGVRVAAPWLMLGEHAPDTLPNSWAIQAFVQSFTAQNGTVGSYAGYGADAISMLHNAYAGHRDRGRAREVLEHMTYVGPTGVFRMTPANHAGLEDGAITTVVVRDGAWSADDDRP